MLNINVNSFCKESMEYRTRSLGRLYAVVNYSYSINRSTVKLDFTLDPFICESLLPSIISLIGIRVEMIT